ncbi:unnamed protein product [Sphenostylis stenocarpa]|uniref:Uncharacterized protein n=1 Tax=Sphenostylis stenocarpa TaxID=92480 RepID=A0AA86VZD4_9FABA|nr:unnamed protein product [Sphenostylis stenocarpa]
MAPPPADLRQIGAEGFALIDKFYGPPRRSSGIDAVYLHGRRERCSVVYQVPKDVMDESSVIGKEPVGPFSGISVVNYPKPKPQNRWGRPFKLDVMNESSPMG